MEKSQYAALSATDPIQPSEELRQALLYSVHRTLIQLGDLFRYRETELATKNFNWGPAIGYYSLARRIYPASGTSHNQLAVIARVNGDHLAALYHQYRALTTVEPHDGGRGNLEVEVVRVEEECKRKKGGEAERSAGKRANEEIKLVDDFLRLHALCYRGSDSAEHAELEGRVCTHLAEGVQQGAAAAAAAAQDRAHKIVLSGIAAEYIAGVRLRGKLDSPTPSGVICRVENMASEWS